MRLMSTLDKAEKRPDRHRPFQILQHECRVQFLSAERRCSSCGEARNTTKFRVTKACPETEVTFSKNTAEYAVITVMES
jgi:hypothetical protein